MDEEKKLAEQKLEGVAAGDKSIDPIEEYEKMSALFDRNLCKNCSRATDGHGVDYQCRTRKWQAVDNRLAGMPGVAMCPDFTP